MTDRYEKFKEWFKKKSHRYGVWKIDDNGNQEIYHYSRAFIDFEEEQAEKEKEKQVKGIIKEVFNTVPLNEYEVEDEYFRKTIYVPNDIITEIYDKLKEKDLIK